METMSRRTHGGRREGAGRPPTGRKQQVTVQLQPRTVDLLDREADETGQSRSEVVDGIVVAVLTRPSDARS